MLPSPSLRCSQGWDCMAENGHKRGRSFESGLAFKNRDDDLVLFKELQNQEKDNFLLHTADDIEESISKLRHFSDFKLAINIPTRVESTDLLNVEDDKNDYDWLLTPPDTPLFPSLDDEYTQPVNLVSRGRARSQPIASRSLPDNIHQTCSSPYRRSPSPRSSFTSAHMRKTPSSVPRTSPPPSIRSVAPNRSSSTLPNKQSIPTRSSSTPTLQMASTSCSIQSSIYGGRGPSPLKTNRGNSASPKLRGWQMTLPGFTTEVPPNLRTSLSDRSVSHTRGSSPASANGRELSGKFGRKSMSPTSSRSISSSNGQARDFFSSHSKRSMVSSGDDEESLHSIGVGISRSSPGKYGALARNKTMSNTRKPSRYSPTNSLPKRSFDSSLRLMDHRKTPQNMFRPLLSSVPATTFRPIFSRNSSLTTSSNASSEQGVFNVALDVEGSEVEPSELPVGWERTEDSENHEEVFLFDKVDEIIEVMNHEVLCQKPQRHDENCGEIWLKKFDSENIQNPKVHINVETNNRTLDSTLFTDNHCDMDGHIMMAVCSKCNKEFEVFGMNDTINLCQECAEENTLHNTGRALTCAPLTKNAAFLMDVGVGAAGKDPLNNEVHEFHEVVNIMGANSLPNICSIQFSNQRESELSVQHLERNGDINVTRECSIVAPQLSNHAVNPSLKFDNPEGAGISLLLLQRSGSSKWPILQGKTVSATSILCSEPSYSRDNINSLRRSIGRDSASASSSVDQGSSRQTEASIQCQLCREGDASISRYDIVSNAQSISGDLPMNDCESRHLKKECEQTINNSTEFLGHDSLREIALDTEEHVDSSDQSNLNAMPSSFSKPVISESYISEHTDNSMKISTFGTQILDLLGNNDLHCSSAAEIMRNKDCSSSIHADEHPENIGSIALDIEGTDNSGCSEMEEDYTLLNCTSQNDNLDAASKSSYIVNIDLPCDCTELENCNPECLPSHNPAYPDYSNGQSISRMSENGVLCSTSEPCPVVQEHGNHEYSGVIIEHRRGDMPRSLTLEEATDTILFCRSIIHDLAHRAATIGMEEEMEKELSLLSEAQASDRTIKNLGKPVPGLRDSWKLSYKHTPRSRKLKLKRTEPQTKSPRNEMENDENVHEFSSTVDIPRNIDTAKPPKLESKCNCTVM